MRLSSVAILAALGMTLTSSAVWNLSAPSESESSGQRALGDEPEPDTKTSTEPDPGGDQPELAVVDKSSFVAGKTLMVEGRLAHARMLADADNQTFLFVDVRGSAERFASQRAEPLNLAIVIDHSGSMKGQRERNALDAAAGMIRRLRDGDTVSVVSYDAQARVVIPVTTISSITRERLIRDMLDGVGSLPSGNTCISCGIDLGMRTLVGRQAGISRMLLLSDGEANRGIQDADGMRVLARQARTRGVSISSIGVDVDYNERLMSAIAREANGRHYFSETGANLEQIFDQELDSLVTAVAKQAKLIVELAPGVRVGEVFDRSYNLVDRRVIVPMGTFAAEEEKTFLVRLDVPKSPAGERPIASVSLTYEDLTSGQPGDCNGQLAMQMTAAPGEVAPFDSIVLGRLTRSETSRTLEQANALFASGRAAEAQAAVDKHLEAVRTRREQAASQPAPASDPFGRDLDEEFAKQAGALDLANEALSEAQAAPAAAAPSRKSKAQVKRNAEMADALAL